MVINQYIFGLYNANSRSFLVRFVVKHCLPKKTVFTNRIFQMYPKSANLKQSL